MNRTPEEKLIQAIFGETLCRSCHEGRDAQPCVYCGELALSPALYNGESYHSKCLAEKLKL